MKLTEHFDLSEFTRSATADRLHIDNSCPSTLIPQLSTLCKTILEPLRQHFGEPVIISSGYRCPALNKAVGGVPNSQHTLGEAADIILPSTLNPQHSTLKDWFDWIEANCNFDQLILETSNGKDFWIHVSCRKNIKANRHQVFYDLKKK